MTHTTIDVPKFDDVEFDEATHTYRVNGVVLPSVTTVMKPLSSSFYEAVDAGTLSNAADRGTAVHQAIENFLEYGIEDISPEHAGYFAAFKAFLADKNPIIIATETKLYQRLSRSSARIADGSSRASVTETALRFNSEETERALEAKSSRSSKAAFFPLLRRRTRCRYRTKTSNRSSPFTVPLWLL